MSQRSLLVVSAAPDDRPSTSTLVAVVGELRRRHDLRTEFWFLRHGGGTSAVADRVVDDLRTTEPAASFDRIGLSPAANLIRGRLLRRWWRAVDPTWVLLDDGLGTRLLGGGRSARTIARINDALPADAPLEGAPLDRADLWLVPPGAPGRPTGRTLEMPPLLWDHQDALPFRRADGTRRCPPPPGHPRGRAPGGGMGSRPLAGRPRPAGPHAVGPGAPPRHVRPRLWLGLDDDLPDARRLDEEAERCGVADRFTRRPVSSIDTRLCGDVVMLPYRSEGSTTEVREALVTGAAVVTFPVWDLSDPAIRVVPDLDVPAAAAAVAAALGDDRDHLARAAVERFDVRPWVDRFLAELRESA